MQEFIEGEIIEMSRGEDETPVRNYLDVTVRFYGDKNINMFLPELELDQNADRWIRPIVQLIPIKRYTR